MLKNTLTRSQLLNWLNGLLKQYIPVVNNVRKIQDLGNGIVYCFLLNLINPGIIPTNKISISAKLQYQNLSNLKLLSSAMIKLNITKILDIQKIAKMKYQDNYQLLQWFYKYWIQKNKNLQRSHHNIQINSPEKVNKKYKLVKKIQTLKINNNNWKNNQYQNQHDLQIKKINQNINKKINQKINQQFIISQICNVIGEVQPNDSQKLSKIKSILFGNNNNISQSKSKIKSTILSNTKQELKSKEFYQVNIEEKSQQSKDKIQDNQQYSNNSKKYKSEILSPKQYKPLTYQQIYSQYTLRQSIKKTKFKDLQKKRMENLIILKENQQQLNQLLNYNEQNINDNNQPQIKQQALQILQTAEKQNRSIYNQQLLLSSDKQQGQNEILTNQLH